MNSRKIEGKVHLVLIPQTHTSIQRMMAGVPLWFFFWEHHDLLLGCMIADDLSLWELTTIEEVLMKNKIVFEKTSQKIIYPWKKVLGLVYYFIHSFCSFALVPRLGKKC